MANVVGMRTVKDDFPDTATLHAVLSQAVRAPSIHNSQPWRWRVGDACLHLFADSEHQLPGADPHGRERVLSCGAALHHCVVALAAQGWRAQVRRFPDSANPDHLATVKLLRAPTTRSDIALAAAISERRTDRRGYGDRPVPATTVAAITVRLSHLGVTVRQVRSVARLQRIITQAARHHSTDWGYLAELQAWQRSSSAVAVSEDADELTDSAVVLAIGTANDRRLGWLYAGEATSLVLLRATVAGLASCPLSEPLEIDETRDAVQREVFADRASPQMLLRIGWPHPDADPPPRTPRRPLRDVADGLD